MASEQSQNKRGQYQTDEITNANSGATLNPYICVQEGVGWTISDKIRMY